MCCITIPRRYDDYSALKPIRELFYGQVVTVIGTVTAAGGRQARNSKMQIFEAILSDGTGSLRLTFFNQPWLVNQLKEGNAISVSGKVDQYLGRMVMNSPEWEPVEVENLHTNRIVPIYPLTQNVTQKWLRKLMQPGGDLLGAEADRSPSRGYPPGSRFAGPGNRPAADASGPPRWRNFMAARQRLAFDEIFFLQMGVLRQRRDWQSAARAHFRSGRRLACLTASLACPSP